MQVAIGARARQHSTCDWLADLDIVRGVLSRDHVISTLLIVIRHRVPTFIYRVYLVIIYNYTSVNRTQASLWKSCEMLIALYTGAIAAMHVGSGALLPAVRHAPIVALFGSAQLPDAVAELLDPAIPTADVVPLWREFRKGFPSEEEAIRAARRNTAVLLPFMNTADNIRFNWQVLGELGFSKEEALEIVTANPGILGNKPGQLARSSQGEIRASVSAVGIIDAIPEPIRMAVPPITAVFLVVGIANRLIECSGGICG